MANTIAGGVQLINTLTQKNNGEFPIVMAESVSLNDGTTVEDKFKTIVNYSHPNTPGYKHVPAGGSDGQILRWKADGEAQWGDDNTGEKYEVFKPATSTTSAVDGLVPAPSINETNRFLKSDGTWGIPTDTTYEEVTEIKSGLMSSSDKVKLDAIEEEANKYVHPTGSGSKHIPSGGSSGKILRWKADGEAQWGDDDNTVYTEATESKSGLMSYVDKIKLNTVAENANNYSHPTGSGYKHIPSGGSAGQILRFKSDGEAEWGDDTNTTYSEATESISGLMSSSDKKKLNTIAENANNYTHPTGSGNNHIPSGGTSGQILRWDSDGTAMWGEDKDTTYKEATSTISGLFSSTDKVKLDNIAEGANNYVHPTTSGNKHIPSGGTVGQILRYKSDGEAQWGDDINTTYSEATETSSGLMSSTDKVKLDAIEEEANKYVHPTGSGNKHIPSGGSSGQILRWSSDGTALWGEDKDTTYSEATQSVSGLFSSTDKKKLDTIAENANNYVHPTTSGNKHIPSGGTTGQILRWSSDGTAVWGDETETSYSTFKGATASTSGTDGLVPAPSAGNQEKYLRADGTWQTPPDNDTTYSVATQSANGLFSSTDKKKLDNIADNANNYTHPTGSGYNHIPSGGASGQILRWSSDGTAVWGADNNTTYTEATQTSSGLLSSTDKKKLDSIEENANNYTHPSGTGYNHIPSGGSSGQVLKWSADGTAQWGTDENTTYSEATSTTAGLLSALDKKKLDTVAENANNYSHPITSGNKHIPSGGSAGQILRWSSDGTATWGDDEDTTYSEATQTTSGLLSSTDKKKIDNIAEGANNYVHPTTSGNKHVPSGGSSGQILIWSSDGTATWGSDKNTTYTLSGSASSSNGNSKITLTSSDSSTNSVTVKGTGGSTVTTDASGNMSINSITVVGSSTAPTDQTVGSIWIKTETA